MNLSAEAPPGGSARPDIRIMGDRFCEACGYNMLGQIVWMDERLRLPVCRCPECGAYHAASDPAIRRGAWLRRLSQVLLMVWVLLAVALILGAAIGEFALAGVVLGELTTSHWSTGGYASPRVDRILHPTPELLSAFGVALAGSWVFGALVACFLTHWRQISRLLLVTLMPCAVALVFRVAGHSMIEGSWWIEWIEGLMLLEVLGGVLGILLGRVLARWVIRLVLPPCFVPYLAVLWRVDGKPLPSPRPAGGEVDSQVVR